MTSPLVVRSRRFGIFRENRPLPSTLTPQKLHAAYQLPASTASSRGQTIALVELGGNATLQHDLAVFDHQYGLPSCTAASGCFRSINASGASSPLPHFSPYAGEVALDTEMAHAICEDCHLLVVEGDAAGYGPYELSRGVQEAVKHGATEVSVSYEFFGAATEAEEAFELAEYQSQYFEHPGVVITASSGDCGYDDAEKLPGEFSEKCKGRPWHYPSFPAKLPDVVAVGGTTLSAGRESWHSAAWVSSGSGCSKLFTAPAWQTSLPGWSQTGCGTHRSVADVAAVASCDPGVSAYSETVSPDWYNGAGVGWASGCGTSIASPMIAAEFGLAGGARGVWPPAKTLYAHAGDRRAFYDVSSGANGTCGGTSECAGRRGYDGPTGLGSPVGLFAFSLAGAPLDRTAPRITGRAAAGRTLSVAHGSWRNGPKARTIQWERCRGWLGLCEPVRGGERSTYAVPRSDGGDVIAVLETASNASGYGPWARSRRIKLAPAPR